MEQTITYINSPKSYLQFILLFSIILAGNVQGQIYKLNNKVEFNLNLKKAPFEILEVYYDHDTIEYNENESVCNLYDDTLKFAVSYDWDTYIQLNVLISGNNFLLDVWKKSCNYEQQLKVVEQRLIVNQNKFNIGDTLLCELFCKSIYQYDSLQKNADTITITGKYKLKIRDSNYTWRDLQIENNYKKYLSLCNSQEPDTVKIISLWDCGLSTIPKNIIKFKNITHLNLDGIDLSKENLKILEGFKYLTELKLYGCNLSKFPELILKLKNLEYLDIGRNNITTIDIDLSSLQKLSYLALYENKLTSLPLSLFEIHNLNFLYLGQNNLTSLPPEILHLKKLITLSIYGNGNQIKTLPASFFNSLEWLYYFYPPECMPPSEYKDFKYIKNVKVIK